MRDFIQRLPQLAASTNGKVVVLLAVLLSFAVLLWALRTPLHKLRDRSRIRRAIQALGDEALSNLVIPDGLDDQLFIEHLVRTPGRLLVVYVKRYSGAIFGAEKMDMWAQVTPRGSYKFPNPLREVEDAIVALRALLPRVLVEGVVIFDRDSSFPKGKPPGVLHISEIKRGKKPGDGMDRTSDAIRESWARLRQFQQKT